MATTTFGDIHSDLIQTHILPLLDGPSLSSTAATSSFLQTLCSDDNLWSHICNSTWPSVNDPRLHDIISTLFPSGHQSFFQDSFPALVTTDVNHHNHRRPNHPFPSQIISAVDIRYKNDIVYSKLEFTDTTYAFLSSELRIRLNVNEDTESKPEFQSIKLEIGELHEATLLEESMSLNWIIIDPTQKRAGNISSVKPVSTRKGWMNENGDSHLLYATVLPGCDENQTAVQCRIQVVVGVDVGSMGLRVKEVVLELLDMEFCRLKGREFLVITQGALLEENNVRRKVVDDEESRSKYLEFKRMSINSLSNLQSETQKDMVMVIRPCQCFLQKLFHLLCIMLVVFVILIYSSC